MPPCKARRRSSACQDPAAARRQTRPLTASTGLMWLGRLSPCLSAPDSAHMASAEPRAPGQVAARSPAVAAALRAA
eukprot:6335110-Prymnesium_polylepis.1